MSESELIPFDDETASAPGQHQLATVLPPDFRLTTLLTFLPDVRYKRAIEAAAAVLDACDVTEDNGLADAEQRLGYVAEAIRDSDACFEEPVSLANQLHKRLTGLRADFKATGIEAMDRAKRRILTEKRRRDQLAEEERRRAQAEADERARKEAAEAAKAAKKEGAPKEVVQALRDEAKTAMAPPVAVTSTARLSSTSAVANWKCRLAGSNDEEPNPDITEMTPAQAAQVVRLLAAIVEGKAPLAAIKIDWSYLNRRAGADKTTFSIPELEAFDAGSLRMKGRR